MDEFRRKLQSLKTEKQNQLLVSTSELQARQSELERIKLHVKAEEEEKLQREDKKKDISRELSQITQAIRNLYGRCFSTMRIKPVFAGQKETASVSDLLYHELDIIHIRISDLIEIHSDFKIAMAEATPLPPSTAGNDLRDTSVFSSGATVAAANSTAPPPVGTGGLNGARTKM